MEFGIYILVRQTGRACFAFCVGDCLREDIANATSYEKVAQHTPRRFAPNRIGQRPGGFGFNRDGDIDVIVHLVLLLSQPIARVAGRDMRESALAV
jgi:hypothetical protein